MAGNKPKVFMDIEAGGNTVGRLVFELFDGKKINDFNVTNMN